MSVEGQKLLIKMYTYRVMGVLFALVGLGYFAVLYTNIAEGNFMRLFQQPTLMLWLVAPFLPSSFLFWLQGRVEKKLRALLEQTNKQA